MTARVSAEMQAAMQLIESQGLNPSQAAIKVGIHPSTVLRSRLYREFKARMQAGASCAMDHSDPQAGEKDQEHNG